MEERLPISLILDSMLIFLADIPDKEKGKELAHDSVAEVNAKAFLITSEATPAVFDGTKSRGLINLYATGMFKGKEEKGEVVFMVRMLLVKEDI